MRLGLQAYIYNCMVQMLIPELLSLAKAVMKCNVVTALAEAKIKHSMLATCKFDFLCKLYLEGKLCQQTGHIY